MHNKVSIPDHIPPHLVFDYNYHSDARVNAEVHTSLETLHDDAPDVFFTPYNGGHWVITRHDTISDIVRDPEHFSASEMQIPRIENPPMFIPLNLDPPKNIPYRQALMPAFSPKAIKALEGKIRYWAGKLSTTPLQAVNVIL